MYYETVKTPSKCSHNLWIIKVNKKPEITLPGVHCIYVIKFQLESLLWTYHIFSYFDFHSLFFVKKKYKSNQSFSCKASLLAVSFLPPLRFEIFTAGFSSRIFIFPLVYWLRKSAYSSLSLTSLVQNSKTSEIFFRPQNRKLGGRTKLNSDVFDVCEFLIYHFHHFFQFR